MKRHEIVSLQNLSMMQRRILDTGPPVGFEVEIAQLSELNKIMLDIISGKRVIETCIQCAEPKLKEDWIFCPKCEREYV